MVVCKLSKAQKVELQKLLDAFDTARSDLTQFLIDIQGEWETALEEKSERWHESEAADAAQARVDTVIGWLAELPEDGVFDVDEIA